MLAHDRVVLVGRLDFHILDVAQIFNLKLIGEFLGVFLGSGMSFAGVFALSLPLL